MRSLVFLLVGAAVSVMAAAQSLSLDSHVIGNGSDVRARSACFRLYAVIGEPAPGFSSGGIFALSGGFTPQLPTQTADDIFFSAFEACTP